MEPRSLRNLAKHWTGRLSHYRTQLHDEHREALVVDAVRFAGLQLESDLSHSSYWSSAPLLRRVAVLLYLVDRGVVSRRFDGDSFDYEPHPQAESWALAQPPLSSYLEPTLELIAALRNSEERRSIRTSLS